MENADFVELTAIQLRRSVEQYLQLLEKKDVVAAEIASLKVRAGLLVEWVRLEGGSCDVPWERNE